MKLARLGPAGREIPARLARRRQLVRPDAGRLRCRRRAAAHRAGRRPGGPRRRVAGEGVCRRPVRAAARPDRQDRLHRAELPRPRRRDRRGDPGRAGALHEGTRHGGRPGRHGAGAARQSTKTDWEVELAVVIGRTARYLGRRPRTALGACRRLRGRTRRLRARVPDRARRPVGQGQELRDLQPARPVAGDGRRGRRPAGTSACGCGSTASCARTAAPRDMIFGVAHVVLVPQPVHDAATPATSSTPARPAGRRHGPARPSRTCARATSWSSRSTASAGSGRPSGRPDHG